MLFVRHFEPVLVNVVLALPPHAAAHEDKDDVFIENLNLILFLALGVLALAASVILFGYSIVSAVYGQQFLSSPTTFVAAALLLLIGSVSMQLFRKRRDTNRKRVSPFS